MKNGNDATAIEFICQAYPFFAHVGGRRDGFDLQFTAVGPGEAFAKVLKHEPFQVNEFSFANYSLMRDRGQAPMNAIPVFLNRAFRHGSIYVRRDSDLSHPADLRGKSIGAREYSQTAGVWWRGTMIDEYDLHWTEFDWVIGPNPRFAPPQEASVRSVDGDLEQLVIAGEIDALLAPRTDDEKKPEAQRQLRPLMPDTEAAERDYYARTGFFPLNHAVVIREDVLAAHPDLPKVVFDACCASKAQFYANEGMRDPWGDPCDNDPIPFGMTEKNREIMATLLRYLHEQKFISRVPDIDPMFVAGAGDWVDG